MIRVLGYGRLEEYVCLVNPIEMIWMSLRVLGKSTELNFSFYCELKKDCELSNVVKPISEPLDKQISQRLLVNKGYSQTVPTVTQR